MRRPTSHFLAEGQLSHKSCARDAPLVAVPLRYLLSATRSVRSINFFRWCQIQLATLPCFLLEINPCLPFPLPVSLAAHPSTPLALSRSPTTLIFPFPFSHCPFPVAIDAQFTPRRRARFAEDFLSPLIGSRPHGRNWIDASQPTSNLRTRTPRRLFSQFMSSSQRRSADRFADAGPICIGTEELPRCALNERGILRPVCGTGAHGEASSSGSDIPHDLVHLLRTAVNVKLEGGRPSKIRHKGRIDHLKF